MKCKFSTTQDWSSVNSLLMVQQDLDDFFELNQQFQFSQFAQRVSQRENVLNDFRPNLDVLRVEHTCALDILNNTSAETIINLTTKTLHS